ncbi:hypothetical protein VTI74DRAFT_7340 [Chaetomium olivicolor]
MLSLARIPRPWIGSFTFNPSDSIVTLKQSTADMHHYDLRKQRAPTSSTNHTQSATRTTPANASSSERSLASVAPLHLA